MSAGTWNDGVRRAAAGLVAAVVLCVPAAAVLAQEEPPEPRFPVSGYVVEGENPLSEPDTQAILQSYTGEAVTLTRLQGAVEALEKEIRSRGYAFHRVTLPPQTAKGVVTLKVVSFRLGQVSVRGNKHFSEANILASVPHLAPGTTPNSRQLARNVALAEEHPSKRIDVVMKQGVAPDTIDADVEVADIRPWSVFGSIANTGTDQTGKWRLSLGGQHSNLFGRDHQLTASYTTSPEKQDRVSQYGLHYRAPVYGWGGSFTAFYSKSDVDSGTVAQFFDVTGSGQFRGAGYTQVLLPIDGYKHRLGASVENKYFDSTSRFAGVVVSSIPVRSVPLSIRYDGRKDFEPGKVAAFYGEYAINLDTGSLNNDAAYQVAIGRLGAERDWHAFRFGADALWPLPARWNFSARLRAQYADQPLISGEQFGLGGASSVRGLNEREISGDRGYQASAELWLPPLGEGVQALGFVDGGEIRVINPVGIPGTLSAASAGVGLRVRWKQNVAASLDVARVIDAPGIPGTSVEGHSKGHFSLLVRF